MLPMKQGSQETPFLPTGLPSPKTGLERVLEDHYKVTEATKPQYQCRRASWPAERTVLLS
eukprot:1139955-Pelagomonas_calceolata.AAC.3